MTAQVDTHAKRGDAKQAPSARMGSAVGGTPMRPKAVAILPEPEWRETPTVSGQMARQNLMIACLCDNLMSGRDPFEGFPKPGNTEWENAR